MSDQALRAARRTDTLSKERIVHAAAALLDEGGEAALTFRALAGRLSTGPGAIYHRIADKDELLAATTDGVVAEALAGPAADLEPVEAIRAAALAVFDAIDAHPWMGAQLAQEPWQPAVLRILDRLGAPLPDLGVPESAWFDAASALLNYVSGLAAQYAAGLRVSWNGQDRDTFLAATADRWQGLDPEAYPFIRRIAPALAGHDDRAQFIAGIDLIITGIRALR